MCRSFLSEGMSGIDDRERKAYPPLELNGLQLERIGMKTGDTVRAGEELGERAREAFAGWPMVIGWAAMLVFAFHASTHMVAAGDTWVAMACGRHFVNHGVDTIEPFSANSH